MRRLKRWHKAAIIPLVVFLLLPIAGWFVLDEMGAAAVRREMAKIRAKGEPVTWRDLVPPPVPDAENAALVYERAFRLLAERGSDTEDALVEALGMPQPWTDEGRRPLASAWGREVKSEAVTEAAAWDALRTRLQRNTAALDLLHQANALNPCRFDLDYSQGTALLLPHLLPLRTASRLLVLRCRLRRRDRDVAGAYDDVVDLIRLERATRQPFLVCNFVGVMILNAAADEALKPLLGEKGEHPEAWRRVLHELEAPDPTSRLLAAMQGERVIVMQTMDAYLARPGSLPAGTSSSGQRPIPTVPARPLLRYDEARYLRHMSEVVRLGRMEYWQAAPEWPGVDAEVGSGGRWNILTRLFMTGFMGRGRMNADCAARLALARAALALRLSRHDHGAYPADLAALAPAILKAEPADPFTGKPLVYRRAGDGFIAYSVGADGTDDGGKEEPLDPRRRTTGLDIVWKAER